MPQKDEDTDTRDTETTPRIQRQDTDERHNSDTHTVSHTRSPHSLASVDEDVGWLHVPVHHLPVEEEAEEDEAEAEEGRGKG